MRRHNAFTMVELIMVILIVSVLAVSVGPKLVQQSEFSAFAIRDQLLGQLRLAQIQALHHRGICHNVIVTPVEFGIIDNNAAICGTDSQMTNPIALDGVTVGIGSTTSLDLRFDGDGRPAMLNGAGDCVGGCVITITGRDTVTLIIESEGYIHD